MHRYPALKDEKKLTHSSSANKTNKLPSNHPESASVCSLSSQSSGVSDSSAATSSGSGPGKNFPVEQANLDFKIIVEQKSGSPITLHLVAPTMQEKQAWISDISQVRERQRRDR